MRRRGNNSASGRNHPRPYKGILLPPCAEQQPASPPRTATQRVCTDPISGARYQRLPIKTPSDEHNDTEKVIASLYGDTRTAADDGIFDAFQAKRKELEAATTWEEMIGLIKDVKGMDTWQAGEKFLVSLRPSLKLEGDASVHDQTLVCKKPAQPPSGPCLGGLHVASGPCLGGWRVASDQPIPHSQPRQPHPPRRSTND